jgi:hypothetical protein
MKSKSNAFSWSFMAPVSLVGRVEPRNVARAGRAARALGVHRTQLRRWIARAAAAISPKAG